MSQAQSDANAPTALHGLVVLDLTRVRSGPTCVRQLGDWGADVIKIELPEGRGETHDIGGRHNPDFQNLHRNKRSLTLDLKTADGIAILKRMVAKADVVVENYRPDVKHRLGIDYATLAAINPRLIYASISGFGQTGPYSDRPGVDQIAQGMSGLMSVTGEPGRGPMRVGTALADLSAGLFAALGILLALQERTRSGLGQQVETSLLAAQIFMLDFQAARYLMAGEVAGQAGNNHPTGVPTGLFRTHDGHVNIAPTPPMWPRFCKAAGLEDIVKHPDFASAKARARNRDKLNAMIEAVTAKLSSAEVIERMNAAGIPSGPVYTLDQTFADPQVRHLGLAQEVVSPRLGPIRLVGQPVMLGRTPSRLVRAAPEAGEETTAILSELGYSDAEIAHFSATGVT